MRKIKWFILLAFLLILGCGNTSSKETEAGSFVVESAADSVGDGAASPQEAESEAAAGVDAETRSNAATGSNSAASQAPATEQATPKEATAEQPVNKLSAQGQTAQADEMPAASAADGNVSGKPADKNARPDKKAEPAGVTSAKEDASAEPRNSSSKDSKGTQNSTNAAQPAAKAPAKPGKDSTNGISTISWSGFFDNEDQTTPSDQFWDLSGSQVAINGYMGEILSFDKNWFLLIPAPGAECPFDNGDETYWNKIMIVYVPADSNLRHHKGPLKVSGRLDVGIKVDESGYKTMFRIYDAEFEEITE
ncbi:hypothetical protein K0T92_15590 [Paenibacillus oenotherae]|uniref:Lipoprotein n=1 Tax=Paenibacillus oenotherae TaxID=1435645 RepID=A0ABS7D9C2_9BACL|nr:hypothetical protein [Paenibacillus oenotherae]MBW7476166.1 hypothetical protein [Paenibacillus oenotherae]